MRSLGVLALASVLPLAACGRKSSRPPGEFVQLSISDPVTLDPAWFYDTTSHSIVLNLYETLVGFKGADASTLEPRVSERVPSRANGLVSADGRTYVFPIRKGIRFHDGSELTPEDVRYSLMRFMLLDRPAGPSSILLEPVAGVATARRGGKLLEEVYERVDRAVRAEGEVVTLTLKEPFAPLLTVLASWAPVLSRSWCAAHGEWDGTKAGRARLDRPDKESSYLYDHANGSGPFLLERWDPKARELVLKRFEGYRLGPARLSRAVLRTVDDFQTRKLLLQAGDADAIHADRLQLPLLRGMEGVELLDGLPILETNPVVFFTFRIDPTANPNIGSGKLDGEGIPPDFFADKDIRRAFAHAFDYDGFIRDVNGGEGSRISGFIPEGLLGHSTDGPRPPFDLEKAERFFRAARGGEVWRKGFRFTIAYNTGSQPREAIVTMLKRSVEGINPRFHIDARPIQWSAYLEQMNRSRLPVFLLGWSADYPDPHAFAFPFMHSQGRLPSIQRYKNAEADRLVTAAMRESDPAKRARMYARLQAVAHEDIPALYLLRSGLCRVQRTWVKGFLHRPVWPDGPFSCPFYDLEVSRR